MSTATPERHTPEPDAHLRFLLNALCVAECTQADGLSTLMLKTVVLRDLPDISPEIIGDIPAPFKDNELVFQSPTCSKPYIIATEHIAPEEEDASFERMKIVAEALPHVNEVMHIGSLTLRSRAALHVPHGNRIKVTRVTTDFIYGVGLDIGVFGEKTYPITQCVTRDTQTGYFPLNSDSCSETETTLKDALVIPADELPPLNDYIIGALFAAELNYSATSLEREL